MSGNRRKRGVSRLASASIAALTIGLMGGVAAAEPRAFDLAADDAVEAIPEFGRQAGVQIVAPARHLEGLQTQRVVGTMEPRDALLMLLQGTGLEVASDNGRVITLRRESEGDRLDPTEGGSSETAADDQAEIVVTGTRIRGVEDLASPSINVTRQEIEASGVTSVEALTESLPQNFSEVGADASLGEGVSTLAGQNIVERASGIDLRGLGAQSTLTLINGTRRAGGIDGRIVDVSLLPLSVVERVEIVTGGRSAIYGSEAVAGVVNFVTRHDFDGAETQFGIGASEYGGAEFQAGQLFGRQGADSGFVVAFDYRNQERLDIVDTGLVANPSPNGVNTLRYDLIPETERSSIFAAGHIDLTPRARLSGDVLYAHKDLLAITNSQFTFSPNAGHDINNTAIDTYSASVSLQYDFADTWQLDLTGFSSRSIVDSTYDTRLDFGFLALTFLTDRDLEASTEGASLVVNGDLPLGPIAARAAFGVEYRQEEFDSRTVNNATFGNSVIDFVRTREVISAFGELLLPLIDRDGAGRVELSLAGRYDEYSDVGGTFNPQVGLVWEPMNTLTVRASYATAFRTFALGENQAYNALTIETLPDTGGGTLPVLVVSGAGSELEPETAETWTASIDWRPAPWITTTLSYFNVDYRDRLDTPALGPDIGLVLQREDRFPGLVYRNPTPAQLQAILAADRGGGGIGNSTGTPFDPNTQDILAVFPNLVVFDNTLNNIAAETVDGVDLGVRANRELSFGELSFGLNATYTLEHSRNVTETSPTFSRLNEVGKPVDFRARALIGLRNGPLSGYVGINYTAGYDDPYETPIGSIDPWTTYDLTLIFDTSEIAGARPDDFRVSLSFQNILNEEPPLFEHSAAGLLYDPANASATGRTVSLRFTNRW
jgi:iron complex outermembrane receptor protein